MTLAYTETGDGDPLLLINGYGGARARETGYSPG